jgi:hypothetical protein
MPNSKHAEPRARLIKRNKPIDVDGPRARDPHSQYETVSPEQASEYLKRNRCNRPLRKSRIDRYAKTMTAGKWRTTHQGLCFDRRGFLVDGQHRLNALILAGVTLRFLVTRDLAPEANDGIDDGMNRSVQDVLHYKGVQVTQLHVGLVKWMTFRVGQGLKTSRAPRYERMEFYLKHSEAISFVVSLFVEGNKIPRIRIAPMMAVFARAYYTTRSKAKLERAAEVMLTGLGGEPERWLIMLRNYLLTLRSVSGEIVRREVYLKTERALSAYLHGEEVVGNLRPAKEELFPIPGEKAEAPESEGE